MFKMRCWIPNTYILDVTMYKMHVLLCSYCTVRIPISRTLTGTYEGGCTCVIEVCCYRALDIFIYRVSQEECARMRESVPYVKVYRYNPKHPYPNLNGYWDNGQRKVRFSCGSTYCTCSADALEVHCECPWDWNAVNIVPACPCKVLGTLRTTTAIMRVFM